MSIKSVLLLEMMLVNEMFTECCYKNVKELN